MESALRETEVNLLLSPEKNKKMSISDLVKTIVPEFLESKSSFM